MTAKERVRFWVNLPKSLVPKLDQLAQKDQRSRAKYASLLLEEAIKAKGNGLR